jgi:hypothetical protein
MARSVLWLGYEELRNTPVKSGLILAEVKDFFSITCRQALWSTQPTIQSVPGASSLGVRRQEREADQWHCIEV